MVAEMKTEAPIPETIGGESKPSISTPQSSFAKFELPCGFLDAAGVLHTYVELSELDGEDEDLMYSDMASSEVVNRILARHMERIGTYSKAQARKIPIELTAGDRLYLLIALRRHSIGDGFDWWMICPKCKEKVKASVDLRTLEVKRMSDPTKRVFEETSPSGKKVRWKVLTGYGEGLRDKTPKKAQKDRPTFALSLRLDAIDDVPATQSSIKQLSLKDRNWLRERFSTMEGGIETDVQFECPSCNKQIDTELAVGEPSFFFPSE